MRLLSLAGMLLCGCAASPAALSYARRERAADFTLADTDGRAVSLHDLLARGPVILAFFPKAFTAG